MGRAGGGGGLEGCVIASSPPPPSTQVISMRGKTADKSTPTRKYISVKELISWLTNSSGHSIEL